MTIILLRSTYFIMVINDTNLRSCKVTKNRFEITTTTQNDGYIITLSQCDLVAINYKLILTCYSEENTIYTLQHCIIIYTLIQKSLIIRKTEIAIHDAFLTQVIIFIMTIMARW